MFGWGKRKKKEKTTPAKHGGEPAAGDEWDFLRAQPDHDADLMAEVHAAGEDAEAPAPAQPAPSAHFDPSLDEEEPGLLDLPDPEEPRRTPRRVERSVVPAPEVPASAGEHATKPLTLLSELCAKFQDSTEARPEWETAPPGPEGWTLTLELTVAGRTYQRTVFENALIGRHAPDAEERPDIDLGVDDTISRRHARIYSRGGRYWLQDLESMNGTRHNGEWLPPGGETVLVEGDEIALGELCRIKVIDPVMQREDHDLRDLLQLAMGGTLAADREAQLMGWGPEEVPIRADVLDMALERGSAVGLLEEPERP